MKNYLTQKDKYIADFSDSIMRKYRNLKYGISSCHKDIDADLAAMRFEIVQWQSSPDFSTTSECKTDFKSWLPMNLGGDCCDELCNVTIINNTTAAGRTYNINPAQTVWTLVHDLSFTPNVTTTDLAGQQIMGTVVYTNSTTITITFSQAVAGWAYLS
jgi:hypothetical protein